MNLKDYHGIIIDRSQKNKSIFKNLNIIGRKKAFFGLITLNKVGIAKENIDETIKNIQENMASGLFFLKQEYYAHFYRNDELIIVFKNRIFKVSADKNTWKPAVDYGKSLGIIEKQLDFSPNKFEDEIF